MLGRILKKDISRNKVITATLFLFIFLAAMLVSGAVNIIITLFGSMDSLFALSNAPHYVQMHSGEINQHEIDDFARNTPMVKSQQTVAMLGINGVYIYLGDNENSEANSIIENSFVTQNKDFDFLLDTESKIIHVSEGEIAVPIYHAKQYNLRIGDTVRVVKSDFNIEFTIASFVRDVQMNPSIVTSKRFVVHENDWGILNKHIGEIEYLIEFLLYDVNSVNEFEAIYQSSDLPQKDTAVTYSLYQALNALTDGIAAAVIVLISIFLIVISLLCLRYILMATIEEDYREIGVMKAIGINGKDIRKIYMIKYTAMSMTACLIGYTASLFVGNIFTANITLYMGTAPKTIWYRILPLSGTFIVFLSVVLFCRIVLRRFRKISAVEAIHTGILNAKQRFTKSFSLSDSKLNNINVFLGMKAVFNRFGEYGILCFIFIVCAFLMTIPLSFLNTLQSPDFISYMGAGRSNIRIDIFSRQSEDVNSQYEKISAYLENDGDIKKYALFVTSAYKILNSQGQYENIKIEVGDFSLFPLEYLSGSAPANENEIALSLMHSDELGKNIGDTLTLLVGDKECELTLCGIYQDVTNGGKTAKGLLPFTSDNILWCMVNIDVIDGVSIPLKVTEYNNVFASVKITNMADYVSQTMGGLIKQLSFAAVFAFILALAVAVLITAMFFKMLIVKDASQIAVMRSLGISCRDIQLQYVTRAVIILLIGIMAGSVFAVTLGQELAVMFISGVSDMRFIINPIISFIVCPLSLAAVVSATVFFGSISIKKTNIMLIAE
jgi:putative ABC transport system permease protein